MTFVVYVTGDIGAGKSTVTNIFKSLGAETLKADDVVAQLYATDQDLIVQLKKLVGEECFPDGKLDKALLAQAIFSNSTLKQRVEKLVHPRVKAFTDAAIAASKSPVFVYEIPIVTADTDLHRVDEVIIVTAPDDVRIDRLVLRGMSRTDAEKRLMNQKADSRRVRNFRTLNNDGSEQSLYSAASQLFEEFSRD